MGAEPNRPGFYWVRVRPDGEWFKQEEVTVAEFVTDTDGGYWQFIALEMTFAAQQCVPIAKIKSPE